MLLEPPEAIPAARELVRAEDFFREAHRALFRELCVEYDAGRPVDPVTFGTRLQDTPAPGRDAALPDDNLLLYCGGSVYLMDLMQRVYTAAGVKGYAGIVRARALQRRLIREADELIQAAYAAPHDTVEDLLRDAETRMMRLTDAWQGERQAEIALWYDVEVGAIRRRREYDEHSFEVGFKSPLTRLNNVLTPMEPHEFVVVAARPSVGKTAFAVQLAYDACSAQEQRGLFVSLEMSKEKLAVRRLLAASGLSRYAVDSLLYRRGHAGEVYPKLEAAAEQSLMLPLAVIDAPVMTPAMLVQAARRAKRTLDGLDFIVVDYLQLMDADEPISDLRIRITEVSRSLKALAKRMNCVVIALSQLSRAAADDRPAAHHLRESGGIEQDADKILLLHWPDKGNPRRREIGVAKQRDGATDWMDVGFSPRQTWFYNSVDEIPEDD